MSVSVVTSKFWMFGLRSKNLRALMLLIASHVRHKGQSATLVNFAVGPSTLSQVAQAVFDWIAIVQFNRFAESHRDLSDVKKFRVRILFGLKEYKGSPIFAVACRSAASMDKRVGFLRWVKLNDPVHVWNVQTPSGNIGAEERSSCQLRKLLKRLITR